MLIINADDWGRSRSETNAALKCYRARRITSTSAMMFMADSERAADLAKDTQLDLGLHLNFTEAFNGGNPPERLKAAHERIVSYLRGAKYAQLIYNPFRRSDFEYSYLTQTEEYLRLYGKPPGHVDGHHHMHLCANLLLGQYIPSGSRVRRNFSFWPGEKSALNRAYRVLIDQWLARRYTLFDYFFCILDSVRNQKLDRVVKLAKEGNVELMCHPVVEAEMDYLMGESFSKMLQHLLDFSPPVLSVQPASRLN